jgi:hypothetical protein
LNGGDPCGICKAARSCVTLEPGKGKTLKNAFNLFMTAVAKQDSEVQKAEVIESYKSARSH